MKFNKQQTEQLVEQARVEVNRGPHLRFGQALWNAAYDMNPEIMDEGRGGKTDFFYIVNSGTAFQMFIEHYTEQGESSVRTNQSESG